MIIKSKKKGDKIRVLEVITVLGYGGAERVAMLLADSLDKEKFETSVLGMFGNGPLRDELIKKSIPHLYFSADASSRLNVQWQLFRVLKEKEVDIIHVHGSFLLTRCILPAMVSGARVIHTEHAKYSLQTLPRLRFMARFAFKRCQAIVSVSNDLKIFLTTEVGCADDRITVIHNGVDVAKFGEEKVSREIFGSRELSDETVLVVTVGRLEEPKDHVRLLEAWSMLSHVKNLLLVIVGEGSLRRSLEGRAKELGIDDRVLFLGPRSDIARILSTCDMFVLSSKREGFPVALLEAMASKKACIATDVGGIREIIEDEEVGVVVSPEDPGALTSAIVSLIEDKNRRDELGKKGRRLVEERFSQEGMVKKYENLMSEVMGLQKN